MTTWEWLFEDTQWSPFKRPQSKPLGAYINAITREKLDYQQVKDQATQLSTVLVRKYGLQPGDAVSLFSTNTIWYPVAMWAAIRVGGRVNGASPAYTAEEMSYALKTAKSKILITLPSALTVALAAAESAGIPRSNVLLLEGSVAGITSIQQLIEEGKAMKPIPPWHIPSNTDNRKVCGYLNFSSGTTGLPKAVSASSPRELPLLTVQVMLSHHNIIAQCMQLQQLQVMPAKGYSILAVMPLFHITGLVRFCTYPILLNGDSVMLPSYTLPGMCQAIVDFQIEELILVPPILIRLVRDPVANKYDLSCVKRWSSGSAPTSPGIIKEMEKKFPGTGFRQGYGATESTACISCHPPSHYDYKYAATGGMLVANTVAKVLDLDTGKELDIGQTGEICARGPQIAMGYLGNDEATKESFDDEGYLHTGDVGHFDAEGLVHIEDRIKEMIKVKGLQVPPAELEDLLLTHPQVEDCAVLGIKDEYSGEKPKAFVVLKQGVSEDVPQGHKLLKWVKDNKVKYKWLAEVEFVKEVPKSPTGKLLRRILKVKEQKGEGRGLKVREEKARL